MYDSIKVIASADNPAQPAGSYLQSKELCVGHGDDLPILHYPTMIYSEL